MAKKKFKMEWSDEELRCVFNAVVVRNSAIAQRYPGGMSGFVELCPFNDCNENIVAYSSMGGEVNKVIDELIACGFKHKEDFLFVDAGLYLMCGDEGPSRWTWRWTGSKAATRTAEFMCASSRARRAFPENPVR